MEHDVDCATEVEDQIMHLESVTEADRMKYVANKVVSVVVGTHELELGRREVASSCCLGMTWLVLNLLTLLNLVMSAM
jgi:hypothetical protein